jgi:CRP-like cAMP-binding protein
LVESELKRLTEYLTFVSMTPDREVIAQDEQGDYLLIVLEGTIAVDRVQPWGGRARLGEARVGDLLGEMSLLDAGTRFSSCRTLTPCVVAVLEAHALDRMMKDDPRLAAVLLAALARRLSLRLRQASARLSALLTSST